MRTILGYTLSSKAAPFLGTKLRLDNAVMPENSGLLPLISSLNRYSLNSPYENSGLADSFVHLVTEGDPGAEPLQAAADTLAKALAESPVAPKKDEIPPPYMDLAKLARYEGAQIKMDDPLYAKASQKLIDEEAEIQKVDFTLRDLKGKKVTLSELRGKIVMVNFWATWCAPCRLEMSDLDVIYNYFQSQGLVVLSITDEDLLKVGQFLASGTTYRPTVLFDPDQKVHKEFHIDGIPHTYL